MVRTAVVGATGAVGRAMISILAERRFPVSELRLMASARSAGRVVTTPWGDVEIEDLSTADPSGIDVAHDYITYLRLLAPVMLDGSPEEDLETLRKSTPPDEDLFWIAFKEAAVGSPSKWAEANRHRYAARETWRNYFRNYDAFLMPVDFVPAFPHDHSPDQNTRVLQTPEGPRRYTEQIFWPSFAVMTGLPATVAPVGSTKDGLPVGVQILGPWLEDATPIFIAQTLEKEFGFQVPKGFE